MIERIARGTAAAIVIGACLYVPLGTCGTTVCNYAGHGWLFIKYPERAPIPVEGQNLWDLPSVPDPRVSLIRDRLLAQVVASIAAAAFLLSVNSNHGSMRLASSSEPIARNPQKAGQG